MNHKIAKAQFLATRDSQFREVGSSSSLWVVLLMLTVAIAMGLSLDKHPSVVLLLTSSITVFTVLIWWLGKITTNRGVGTATLVALVMASSSIVYFEPAPFDLLVLVILGVWLTFSTIKIADSSAAGVLLCLCTLAVVIQAASLLLDDSNVRFAIITLYMVVLAIASFAVASSYPSVLKVALIGYVLGAVIVTAFAMSIMLLSVPFPVDVTYGELRLQGFFKDANVLAPFLVSALMVLLASSYGRTAAPLSFSWIGRYLAVTILLGGILLAYSRGGWVGLVVTVAVYMATLLVARRVVGVSTLLSLIIVLAILVYVIPRINLDPDSFLVQRAKLQSYDTTRFSVQEDALAGFRDAPLFGHGPGSADFLLKQSTHSLYLRILFENGLVGAISIGALILGAVWHSLRFTMRATSLESQRYGALLFSVLVGSLVIGSVIDILHWRHVWIFVGLGWACASVQARGDQAGFGVASDSPKHGIFRKGT